MILPIIGLILTAVFAVVSLGTDGIPLLSGQTWPTLPSSGRSLITYEVFVNLVFVVVPVTLFGLLFQTRPALPKLLVGFYVVMFLAVLADGIGILTIGPRLIPDDQLRQEAGLTGIEVAGDIGRVFLACAVWIPYFLVSKRVKNTFVNPAAAAAIQQTVPVITQPDGHIVVDVAPTAAAPVSEVKSVRKTRHWVIGVSAFVTLAVLGALIWNCASPGGPVASSSSEVTTMQTYSDPTCGYSFDYPTSWRFNNRSETETTEADSLSSVMVFDPQGAGTGLLSYTLATVHVYELGYTFVDSMLPDLKRRIETNLGQSVQDGEFKVVEPMTAVTLAGLGGHVVTIAETTSDMPTTDKTYYLYHGNRMYLLSVQSASTEWDADRAVFDKIIQSFKLVD